ncbi:ATP-binding cassette domain-containing protein [Streptococcus marmotae]|uniref:ATP-binding cassette domain-containing protein n=1 Tax=Streptococcus marmotae TaxID=1825069 RepID=UPI0008314E49|nr:ATP-binding cassette domain-containing protein [Streptococcus marmotae]
MIEVRNLVKKYGDKLIYNHLSMEFQANHAYAIVGASGEGKSTFLNALARLEKPDDGYIFLDGQDIWKMKEKEYFKQIGYVFQNYALIEEETVYQNLKMLANKKEIEVALDRVGLHKDVLFRKIYELSGGQAQRVSIARLLLKKARIILADEPTGALDSQTGEEILSLLFSLLSQETVLIFATHDPAVCDRVDEIIDIATFK